MTYGTDILAGKRKQKTLAIIVTVVTIVVSLVLLYLGCSCFLRRKETKNQHDILKESCNVEKNTLVLFLFTTSRSTSFKLKN